MLKVVAFQPALLYIIVLHMILPRHESGRSAAWLARLPWEQEVVGSNPTAPTTIYKDLEFLL